MNVKKWPENEINENVKSVKRGLASHENDLFIKGTTITKVLYTYYLTALTVCFLNISSCSCLD